MGDGLDQIKDLKLIIQIMDSLGISTERLNTVDEMKAKTRDYLVESGMKRVSEPQYQAISDASKSDERKRRNLQDLYKKTATFLDKLDTKVKIALQERFGDLKATLEENMTNLLPRNQYPVLVAGETSAGKSSLINLILGEDLLPSAHLCTTFTICELKYGDKPKICLHFKNDGTQAGSPVTHELIDSPEKSYKDQINQYASKRDDLQKTPYEKIELFWPHPLLKEKVVIVDSPGVGESEVMNEFVVKYMPNALCFIYVINSGNAGGVQEDRLGMLISCAQANLTENDLALFNRCALFACNKWDCVDSNEQEKVKEEQIKLLSKKVFNLDPNAQMVHLSCKIAYVCQTRLGYVTEGFHDLTTGICNLLVSSMQNKLEMHYRWLEDVLFHVSRELKLSLETTRLSQQETEDKISRVKKRMQELQESQQRKFDELINFQSEILKDIITKLTEYFKSDEAVKKFCEWSSSEAPEVQATWEETKTEVLKCISKRAQQFTQSWEEETHAFAKAQDRLITHCCEKYDIMEKEIHQVEEYVFSDEVDTEVKQEEYAIRIRPRALSVLSRRIKFITGALPSWQTQGIAPLAVRSSWSMSDLSLKKLDEKIERQRYQDDPCGYMSQTSRKCLVLIGSQDRLLPFIKEQLKDAIDCLNRIKQRIPELLKGDREMYQKLLDDDRSKKEIREIYEPLTTEAELLERELNVFNLAEMTKSDFISDELKWEGDDSIIGSGTFSTVYRGVLAQRRKPEVAVAIKEYKDPLTTRNLWHYFVDEERPLRKLRHPGIVKYFGTCLLHETIGTTVKIVLELCDCSLRKLVTSHPENSPARLSKKPIRNKVLNWALQVLDALRYIHSVGFVHRDLKLDNLLLTHDGQVKLAHVGIGKYEGQLTGTVFGTSLYLAPEVCKGRIYDSRADMYSFGFVLWELWYGEVSFRNMVLSREPSKLLEDIKCGLRPSHIDKTSEPFPNWRKVMESCWEKDPKERMKAGDALKCLNQAKLHTSDTSQ